MSDEKEKKRGARGRTKKNEESDKSNGDYSNSYKEDADCGHCGKEVKSNQGGGACDMCRVWYHLGC
ncbi:hypothetical protein SK128_012407, partial [Halocaridina rubra]